MQSQNDQRRERCADRGGNAGYVTRILGGGAVGKSLLGERNDKSLKPNKW